MFRDIFTGSSSKVVHAKEIYNTIRKNGSITKKELQNTLEIPLTTLNRAIDALKSIDLVEEGEICDSSLGRKPITFHVKSNSFYLIGVEISRTSTKIVLTDMALQVIHKAGFDNREDIEPYTLIKRISAEVKRILSVLKIDMDKVLGVGVGTVGPLNKEKGMVVNVEGFSHDKWRNFPIKMAFEKELGMLTVINDGANAAVLAEYWGDTGRKFRNIAYIIIGVGFRCGVISNGMLVNERNYISNDVYGHIIVAANGRPCYCGNQGCIERYVTIPSIIQSYRDNVKAEGMEANAEAYKDVTWERICESVKSGDKMGMSVITEAAFYLSAVLVNIINTLNPEAVVIGGAAINTSGVFYDFAVSLAKEKLRNTNEGVQFFKGSFGEDEIAVGSATLILDYYLGKGVSESVVGLA